MNLQNIRGTADILPDSSHIWQWIEVNARELFKRFNFQEIRTPVFESTDLFKRSIGEGTDIVTKEMYTFNDRKGRSLTLRPEGTASVVRSLIQHKLIQDNIVNKLFYLGPMFRYERPQAGRQRQFHQFGIEIVGSDKPAADVEAIALLKAFFDEVGILGVKFRINSTGSKNARGRLNETIRERVSPYLSKLCPDCNMRYEKNILRIYDCKVSSCKEIIALLPGISECLLEDDIRHFDEVKNGLSALGIEYEIDDRLVRGLDYYTRTIFEAYSDKLGACDALAGGGRYDELFQELGAKVHTPAVGFAVGIERVVSVLNRMESLPDKNSPDVFVINTDNFTANLKLISILRNAGLSVDFDFFGKSVKAQFRAADRIKSKISLIRGEEEISRKKIKLKKLSSGEEIEVDENQLVDKIKMLL